MKNTIEFTFTGDKKCRLLFCTEGQYGCGCDTCKAWLKGENDTFKDQKGVSFGSLKFKTSETQTYQICSHHIMNMNLVPYDDKGGRKAEELDLRVYGGDLGGTWSDTVEVDGQTCSIKIRVYDPTDPNRVTKVNNKLQIEFTGNKTCKLVQTSLFRCGCDDCKWWEKFESTPFSDRPDIKYSHILFEITPTETKIFDICPHHVMAMNLTSADDATIRNVDDLDVIASGGDIGSLWEDQVEIEGETNKVDIKIEVADSTNVCPPSYPINIKKIRTLQFEFTGPRKCKMVFTVASKCGCSICRWWSKFEAGTFTDQPDRSYGVILFETTPYTTTFDICSRLEMYMNLVPFDADSNKAEDLDVVISGDILNKIFSDRVEVSGESNEVIVKVLKNSQAAKTITTNDQAINLLELNFTGKKKCQLLICPDPELECDCKTCNWWLERYSNSFVDQPQLKYTFINFDKGPCNMRFDLCSNSVMFMNLVPFGNDKYSRNAAELDLQIYGSDVGCAWTDKAYVDWSKNEMTINVYAPPPKVDAPRYNNNNNNNNNNRNHNRNYNHNYNYNYNQYAHCNNQNAAYIRAMQYHNMRIRQAQLQQAQFGAMQAAFGFGQVLGEAMGGAIGGMMEGEG